MDKLERDSAVGSKIEYDDAVGFRWAFEAEMGRRFAARLDNGIQRAGRVVDDEARPYGLIAHVAEVCWGYAVIHVAAADASGGVIGEFAEIKVENHADAKLIAIDIGLAHAVACSYLKG